MSAGTRPVPTNLDTWPGITDLVGPYKHIFHVLWSSPSSLVSVVGVGGPGIIERLTGATRHDEPVILEALRELDRRGLVVLDEETREVGIRRWCAYHKFSGRWAAVAEKAYLAIQSQRIKAIWVQREGVKALFPAKSKENIPNSNNNSNNNTLSREGGSPSPGTSTQPPRYALSPDGISYEPGNDRDAASLARIAAASQPARAGAVQAAAARDDQGRAFASAVLRILLRPPAAGPTTPGWASLGDGDDERTETGLLIEGVEYDS